MSIKKLPSLDTLNKKLHYDPKTGVVSRKFKSGLKPVTSMMDTGYLRVKIDGEYYRLHRIVWKMVHGVDPREGYVIDHLNRNKTDNRIENLREAPQQLNVWNSERVEQSERTERFLNPETNEVEKIKVTEGVSRGWNRVPQLPIGQRQRQTEITFSDSSVRTFPTLVSAAKSIGVSPRSIRDWRDGKNTPNERWGVVAVR